MLSMLYIYAFRDLFSAALPEFLLLFFFVPPVSLLQFTRSQKERVMSLPLTLCTYFKLKRNCLLLTTAVRSNEQPPIFFFFPQARFWMQVVDELRRGVRLKKISCSRTPIEYELTPYEILMEDIRSRWVVEWAIEWPNDLTWWRDQTVNLT